MLNALCPMPSPLVCQGGIMLLSKTFARLTACPLICCTTTRMSRRTSSSGSLASMKLSQVPGRPSFRKSAVNAVAVLPLLSPDVQDQHEDSATFSSQSFNDLMDALLRYNKQEAKRDGEDMLMVVPNSNLTRPGDWKYENTPLKNFHWGHGCQRMEIFDGRPYHSRMAHDRLINHSVSREWIDICPQRRTAALIGVLNMKDCPDMATFEKAIQEWNQWAERYSTPPYEVTAHGRDFERDYVVQRLFVFDSFEESNKIDMADADAASKGCLVAFPSTNKDYVSVMDLHMNVVINDLAVAIFQQLEDKIRQSDAITGGHGMPLTPQTATKRFFSKVTSSSMTSSTTDSEAGPQGSSNLSLNAITSLVSPENKVATPSPQKKTGSSAVEKLQKAMNQTAESKGSSIEAQLLTPLDDIWDLSELSPKDAQGMMRREVGRREKFAGDMALLAGSPIDAYERYTKAAELCKTSTPDPLWYASALEGCAAAHIAMADAGGFNVDQYLEDSFQLPDEFMACAIQPTNDKARQPTVGKQSLPRVVTALCEEAADILNRHAKLAPFYAELLLKLAWYCAEVEEAHLRCRWGLGWGCYAGEAGDDQRRWEKSSSTKLNFLEFKNKHGDDLTGVSTLKRCKKFSSLMHRAVSSAALDPVTRADVALCCTVLCLKGLRPTIHPTKSDESDERVDFPRKAALFAVTASESMSENDSSDYRAGSLWASANKFYSYEATSPTKTYGWATIRASVLHALVIQHVDQISEEAALTLLGILGEMRPSPKRKDAKIGSYLGNLERLPGEEDGKNDDREDDEDLVSYMGAESVVTAARAYVRTQAQDALQNARANRSNLQFFSQISRDQSTLLVAAQSRWVEDKPIQAMLYPLSDNSDISYAVMALKSVWSNVQFDTCVVAQQKLLGQISSLRKLMPTSTLHDSEESKDDKFALSIVAAEISDTSLSRLERMTTKKTQQADSNGAMATFFNPFANKKQGAKALLIAEGEERHAVIEFSNRLSVSVEVDRCQLEFSEVEGGRVRAPAMSFTVPGQARNFAIQFPFVVSSISEASTAVQQESSQDITVEGVSIAAVGQSFFLPLSPKGRTRAQFIPSPAHFYPRRSYKSFDQKQDSHDSPRFEPVPTQPNLSLTFANASASVEEDTSIPVPLSDGEVFSLPDLHMRNLLPHGDTGAIDFLAATLHDVPGQPTTALYTTDEPTKRRLCSSNASPLSLTFSFNDITVTNLNMSSGSKACTMGLSIAASNDMMSKMKSTTIVVRLRYRGVSVSPDWEIWRQRDLKLRIIPIKGPRISSLTLRPDLQLQSQYCQMCVALTMDKKHVLYQQEAFQRLRRKQAGIDTEEAALDVHRVGVDGGVNPCGDSVVVIAAVVNDTKFPIVIKRESGLPFGIGRDTTDSIRIASGVSAKVPMVLTRFERRSAICDDIVAAVALSWQTSQESSRNFDGQEDHSDSFASSVAVNRRVRSGTIKIPYGSLLAIMKEVPAILSRVCKPPVTVALISQESAPQDAIMCIPGEFLDISAHVAIQDWVPQSVIKTSDFDLEFCCAFGRDKDNSRGSGMTYAWCGQKKQRRATLATDTKHSVRLFLLKEGQFTVSACVHIKHKEGGIRETWWAEHALSIVVQPHSS